MGILFRHDSPMEHFFPNFTGRSEWFSGQATFQRGGGSRIVSARVKLCTCKLMGECSTPFWWWQIALVLCFLDLCYLENTWSIIRKCWVDISPYFSTMSELRCHQLVRCMGWIPFKHWLLSGVAAIPGEVWQVRRGPEMGGTGALAYLVSWTFMNPPSQHGTVTLTRIDPPSHQHRGMPGVKILHVESVYRRRCRKTLLMEDFLLNVWAATFEVSSMLEL